MTCHEMQMVHQMRARLVAVLSACGIALAVAACDGQSEQEKVQGFLESAAEKQAAGKIEAAVIELKNAVQLQPENAEARARLGRLHLVAGNTKAAIKELRRAREYGGESLDFRRDLARAYLADNSAEEVLELIPEPDESTELGKPGVNRLYVLRARALHSVGDTPAAKDIYDRLLEAKETYEVRYGLAVLHSDRQDHAAALAQLDHALALRPKDPQGLWLKAANLMDLGRRSEAVEVLQAAREQKDRPLGVDVAFVEAALKTGRKDLAWSVLEELEKTAAETPMVRYLVGLRALTEEDFDKASQIAQELLANYPSFVDANFIAGVANFYQKSFETARKQLQLFVNANPDHRTSRLYLARAWQQLGNEKRAAEVLGTAPEAVRTANRATGGTQYAAAVESNGGIVDDGDSTDRDIAIPDAAERARFAEVVRKLRAGELEAAMQHVEAILSDAPDNATALGLKGAILWAQDRPEDAIAAFEAARAEAPDKPDFALNLSRALRARGKLDRAIATLEDALSRNPENVALKLEAAKTYAAKNERAPVERLLREVLSAEPANMETRVYLARFYLVDNKPQRALEVTQGAPEGSEPTVELLEIRGRAERALGNLAEAAKTFQQMAEIGPDSSQAHILAGEALLAYGASAEAVPYLEEARALAPDNRQTGLYLAQAYLESGAESRADRIIGELESAYPDDVQVTVLRANYNLNYGDNPAAAIAGFEKALEQNPSESRLLDLVRVQSRLGRREAAIAAIDEWRQSHDSSERVDAALAQLQLMAGRYTEAAEIYGRLAQAHPDNAAYHNNLAWTLGETGELEPALVHARKAIELAPEDPGILDTEGMILHRMGRTDEALKKLEAAVKLAGQRPDILTNYAEVLVADGQTKTAREVLSSLRAGELSSELRSRVEALQAKVQQDAN